ncbi:MAG TPA: metalloregulator ArsR/SmtB family transcription factor [Candidatus Thermoplasmatota archaeon]|nr:metalloregulator ArsR/SmtB family transcription factor [Candidatus Thermoplasmatota archaeon]
MPRAVRTRAFADADPRVLRALADPTRQHIVRMLGAGELTAGEIAGAFDSARPTISKHLRVLREAGLVRVRADGRERFYAVEHGPLREAAARVQALDAFLREGLARLSDHLAREK